MDNNVRTQENGYTETFTRPIIRWGRITNLGAMFLCFLPPIAIATIYNTMPPLKDILAGWGLIFSIFGIYAIVEPLSYFPVLGVPGTYMSFLSGNIGNMRVPVSAVAQEVMGVQQGTQKAELVSTLSIAGSIITNVVVTTIAAIGGAALFSLFPPVIIEAFTYVAPAIFGAMFSMNAVRHPKLGAFAIALVLFMILVIRVLPSYVIILVAVFGTVAFDLLTEKKGKQN
ncbi:MAG: hypothetical protein ACOX00_03190 [Peptoniphilaceae bacterium]|jgi:hypothetical protein